MEEIKKEIQSLKRKTLYLEITLIVFIANLFFATVRQVKDYAVIRDYYQSTINANQEILKNQERLNNFLQNESRQLEGFLSTLGFYFEEI